MSYLLFLDESGHDHRTTPYEVRGGVALHASELWPFVQDMQRLELAAFGTALHQFKAELKGCKLLARTGSSGRSRRRRCSTRSVANVAEVFSRKAWRRKHRPDWSSRPTGRHRWRWRLGCSSSSGNTRHACSPRLSHAASSSRTRTRRRSICGRTRCFFERYLFFLEQSEHGLLVMDEVEKTEDRRFVRRLEAYFRSRADVTGRHGSFQRRFFVSSDMTYPVQAADLAIYCVNWGFRLPTRGMDAPGRPEIADDYGRWLAQLRFHRRDPRRRRLRFLRHRFRAGIHTRPGELENEKGGNACRATQEQQPLSRASAISIVCRLLEVKGL